MVEPEAFDNEEFKMCLVVHTTESKEMEVKLPLTLNSFIYLWMHRFFIMSRVKVE